MNGEPEGMGKYLQGCLCWSTGIEQAPTLKQDGKRGQAARREEPLLKEACRWQTGQVPRSTSPKNISHGHSTMPLPGAGPSLGVQEAVERLSCGGQGSWGAARALRALRTCSLPYPAGVENLCQRKIPHTEV